MKYYRWRGVNNLGQNTRGIISALTPLGAKLSLSNQGIILQKFSRVRILFFRRETRKLRQADITIFTRHLASLMQAKIPLLQAIELLHQSETKQALRALLVELGQKISAGTTFAAALSSSPRFFNALYCAMIDIGEKSGTLATILTKIADYREMISIITNKIAKVLLYPCIVCIVALCMVLILLTLVMPEFVNLFTSFNAKLPWLTRQVIILSGWCRNYYYIGGCGAGIICLGLCYLQKKQILEYYLSHIVLKIPLCSKLVRQTIIMRFTRAMAIMLEAGLPLLPALRLAENILQNHVYKLGGQKIITLVTNGQLLSAAIENTGLFPLVVTQMIAMGEETGFLWQMFDQLANYYTERVNGSIEVYGILLEPIVMLILGIIIGLLLLAMYFPIFKLGTVI